MLRINSFNYEKKVVVFREKKNVLNFKNKHTRVIHFISLDRFKKRLQWLESNAQGHSV